jgi:hypothetical protein
MVEKSVVKWTPLVVAELQRQGVPLPTELILSVMWVESRGKAGLVNPKSGASGLMQVMPGTLTDFNQRHGRAYTIADMRSDTDAAARKQIEVGIAVLAHYWKRAYKYLTNRLQSVPVDLLAHVADLFYVAGPGATMKRLNQLQAVSWESIQQRFPQWAALPHPRNVFAEPIPWDTNQIGAWIEGPIDKITKDPKTGFALGLIILMVAYWAMNKGKK